MLRKILFALACMCSGMIVKGQNFGLSTNLLGYADFGTLNIEASYALARHWSVSAGAGYNPFSYNVKGRTVRNRQRSVSAGTRYWPWHAFSGWWLSCAFRYEEYSTAGIISPRSLQGDRLGASIGGGYSYMVFPWMNVEVGAGVWGGHDAFSEYSCADCGRLVGEGRRFFLLPADIVLALTFIF